MAARSGRLHQWRDRARCRIPQIDRIAQGDGEDILGIPVEEVEVIIVEELGRVEDALGRLRDVPARIRCARFTDIRLSVYSMRSESFSVRRRRRVPHSPSRQS